jgi:NAD(P)-dependent dehydrogenase (short-subunit alcohol dehydrogenase family)
MSKVWFITGAGRGFGLEFAKAALQRGDQVAATARNTSALDELVSAYGEAVLPLQLDVTDRDAAIAAVQQAKKKFDRLDVVVNNAGYGLFGAVEEITEQQLREQLEVNLFGVLHVTQAVLPILREQGSGHIIQISTIGGVAAFPSLGGYHASKWALEGLTESLAQEVAGFGIKVTLVEPGGYATDWAGSSATHATPQPQYDGLRNAMAERQQQSAGVPGMTGDPVAAGPAILKLADADQPPLRVFFGKVPTMMIRGIYEQRLATWDEWTPLSLEANGGPTS